MKMVTIDAAQQTILRLLPPPAAESVSLQDALHRVAAADVRAHLSWPSSPLAAMDGYAVRSRDLDPRPTAEGATLNLLGSIAPGQQAPPPLEPGGTVRVLTGAPLPAGADAVLPQELAEAAGARVRPLVKLNPGDHLIQPGEELARNEIVLRRGTNITPATLMVLAELGHREVQVWRRPQVSIVATGDELVSQAPLFPTSTTRVAGNAIAAVYFSRWLGAEATFVGPVADDLDQLEEAIRKAATADLVVTTGGTGRGSKDLLAAVVSKLKGITHFHGVKMTPGKHALAASIDSALLIGLPGRPLAAMIAFQQLVRPAILALGGRQPPLAPQVTACLRTALRSRSPWSRLFLARLWWEQGLGYQVVALHHPSRSQMGEMLAANALIRVDPEKPAFARGEQVPVQLLYTGVAALTYWEGTAPQHR